MLSMTSLIKGNSYKIDCQDDSSLHLVSNFNVGSHHTGIQLHVIWKINYMPSKLLLQRFEVVRSILLLSPSELTVCGLKTLLLTHVMQALLNWLVSRTKLGSDSTVVEA